MNSEQNEKLDYGYLTPSTGNSSWFLHGCFNFTLCKIKRRELSKNSLYENYISVDKLIWFWFTFKENGSKNEFVQIYDRIDSIPYYLLSEFAITSINRLTKNQIFLPASYSKIMLTELFAELKLEEKKLIESVIDFENYWKNISHEVPIWVKTITELLLPSAQQNNLINKRNELIELAALNRIQKEEQLKNKLEGTNINFIIDKIGRELYYSGERAYGSWLSHEFVQKLIEEKDIKKKK